MLLDVQNVKMKLGTLEIKNIRTSLQSTYKKEALNSDISNDLTTYLPSYADKVSSQSKGVDINGNHFTSSMSSSSVISVCVHLS